MLSAVCCKSTSTPIYTASMTDDISSLQMTYGISVINVSSCERSNVSFSALVFLPTCFSGRWDVSSVVGRAGQIRIVDASSASPWGHISVDEIVRGWKDRGGLHPERFVALTVPFVGGGA